MSESGDQVPEHPPLEMMQGLPRPRAAPRQRQTRFGSEEAVQEPLRAFDAAYRALRAAPGFFGELDKELIRFAGRPTPLIAASRLVPAGNGARVFLKIEDPSRADAHQRLACEGQALIAAALGCKRLVGALRDIRWGPRVAAACARRGLEADLYVDPRVLQRHAPTARQMRMFGARIHAIPARGDLRGAALQDWLAHPREKFLFLGLDAGPEPFGTLLRDVTGVVGRECRRQVTAVAGRPPALVVAREGENADALSLFPAFMEDKCRRVCVEPALPASPFGQDVSPAKQLRMSAIIEGIEYLNLSREREALRGGGRVEFVPGSAVEGRRILGELARLEGLLTGDATAQALAWAVSAARALPSEAAVAVLLAEKPSSGLVEEAGLPAVR